VTAGDCRRTRIGAFHAFYLSRCFRLSTGPTVVAHSRSPAPPHYSPVYWPYCLVDFRSAISTIPGCLVTISSPHVPWLASFGDRRLLQCIARRFSGCSARKPAILSHIDHETNACETRSRLIVEILRRDNRKRGIPIYR